ncbi:hypothetical protein PK98_09525 [Croceibacterium mercuriale]|uniref:TfoX N-terminal domain-containing protein n=1 Tax=Croceibacterium mercuriale TaxID=1572751 RepID=A0A0B2BYR0_9SPHN|nr:TfoX/Sxy family protein [Croceibacterium mercuriale]KHL26594.1 hypothetical protein PK98_09525 [Croceibacterium mercuriale]
MATHQQTVDCLLEKTTFAGAVSIKPMVGEHGIYVDGKMIGSICDDQFSTKPTASGRLHAEPVSEAPRYSGVKPHLPIEADRWDNIKSLGDMLRTPAAELPMPKPRKGKQST